MEKLENGHVPKQEKLDNWQTVENGNWKLTDLQNGEGGGQATVDGDRDASGNTLQQLEGSDASGRLRRRQASLFRI